MGKKFVLPYLHYSVSLLNYLKEMAKSNAIAELLINPKKENFKEDHPDYIDVSSEDKSKLSYLTEDRKVKLKVSGYFTPGQRYHAKPGKLLNKIIEAEAQNGIDRYQKTLEEFSNMFQSLACYEGKQFVEWSGSDIKRAYLGSNYSSGHGSLNNSCMKNTTCQGYLELYTMNPDVCRCLTLLDQAGKVTGRAILWRPSAITEIVYSGQPKVWTGDDVVVMDRIYVANECDFELFYMYCKQKGYWRKKFQSYRDPVDFFEKGNVSSSKKVQIEIKVNTSGITQWPYMDTVMFLMKDGAEQWLHNNKDADYKWAFRSTSGGKTTSSNFVE